MNKFLFSLITLSISCAQYAYTQDIIKVIHNADMRPLLTLRNQVTEDGRTPLHRIVAPRLTRLQQQNDALAEVCAQTIRDLVAAGADVNAKDNAGRTPLHDALLGQAEGGASAWPGGHPAIVRALLESGADAYMADADGKTPLMLLADMECSSPRAAKVRSMLLPQSKALCESLLSPQADVPMLLVHYDLLERCGNSGKLHGEVICSAMEGVPNGAKIFCDGLHLTSPHKTVLTPEGKPLPEFTPADFWAIVTKAEKTEDAYRAQGERISAKELLTLELRQPKSLVDCRRALIEQGMDDSDLIVALGRGHTDVAAAYLSKHDVMTTPSSDGPPLFLEIFNYDHLSNEPAAMQTLLDAGLNVNGTDENGSAPLHVTMLRCPDNTPLLLAAGADPNARDKKGRTPLMLAVSHPDAPELREVALEALLDAGADVHAKDQAGRSALHYALTPIPLIAWHSDEAEAGASLARYSKGIRHVLIWMISSGADVNAADAEGRTPLHYLFLGCKSDEYEDYIQITPRGMHAELLRLLLRAGANPDLPDARGLTVRQYLTQTQRPEVHLLPPAR